MKSIENFSKANMWFLDKSNSVGPLTMAYKSGSAINATKHFHRSTHEYYIVLDGGATLIVNGKSIKLIPNSVVIVEPGEIHSLTESSNDFKLLLIMEKFVPNDKVEVTE